MQFLPEKMLSSISRDATPFHNFMKFLIVYHSDLEAVHFCHQRTSPQEEKVKVEYVSLNSQQGESFLHNDLTHFSQNRRSSSYPLPT